MTLREALLDSRDTGSLWEREAGSCWVRWDDDGVYRLTAEELVADDWVKIDTATGEVVKT